MKKILSLVFLVALGGIAFSQCISGDCKNGIGEHKDGKRTSYKGNFVAGKPDGKGVLTYKNGRKYVGDFKNGEFDGRGDFTD